MTIRAFNEAARALVMWVALNGDVTHRSGDAKARQVSDDLMGLLTPVLKGVLTDVGFANTVMAQQMYGGHGYIAEHGMEQFVRDARIPMIYEGANGIQALDLVGRKLGKDGGRAITAFFGEVQGYIKDHAGDAALKPYLDGLGQIARPSAAGHHVVHAERHDQARQCRRRLDRLHASVRARRAWLHVVQDRRGRERQTRQPAPPATQTASRQNSSPASFSSSACCRKPRRISPASRPGPPVPWNCRPRRFSDLTREGRALYFARQQRVDR